MKSHGLSMIMPALPMFFSPPLPWGNLFTMVADPELQFSADPNKPIFAGKISGSLYFRPTIHMQGQQQGPELAIAWALAAGVHSCSCRVLPRRCI